MMREKEQDEKERKINYADAEEKNVRMTQGDFGSGPVIMLGK